MVVVVVVVVVVVTVVVVVVVTNALTGKGRTFTPRALSPGPQLCVCGCGNPAAGRASPPTRAYRAGIAAGEIA